MILDSTATTRPPISETLALAEWLTQIATDAPFIVFLDDFNFAGQETLEVIQRTVERMEGTRLMLVLGLREGMPLRLPTAMESLKERTAVHHQIQTLHLRAFSLAEVDDLVQSVFHEDCATSQLSKALYDRSGGSPGALREILLTLRTSGNTPPHPAGGGLMLTCSPSEIPKPRGVNRLIRERMEILSERITT